MLRFAGIDLTSSPEKPSAYALLGAGLKIRFRDSLRTNSEIIAAVECDQPTLVAIDAPLSLPHGLCCMNEDCLCQASSRGKGRLCERELAKNGIPSYFTTKRSIIKKMVCRAIELKKELESRGFKVKEVYPYATKRRLWSEGIPKKTTVEGRMFLENRLSNIITNISEQEELNHDQFDAVVAAYTMYLYHRGETEVVGDHDEGQIVVPRRT